MMHLGCFVAPTTAIILLIATAMTVDGYLPCVRSGMGTMETTTTTNTKTNTIGGVGVGVDCARMPSSTTTTSSWSSSSSGRRTSLASTSTSSSLNEDVDADVEGSILGIIFDIDGTLADSWNLGYRATLTVLAGYHNDHLRNDDENDDDDDDEGGGDKSSSFSSGRLTPETYPLTPEEYHFGCRYTTPERLARHVGLMPDHPSFVDVGEALGKEFDDYYVRLVDRNTAGFYGGIADLLVRLNRGNVGGGGGGGLKLGALTNACVEYAHAVLRANCPRFSTADMSMSMSSDEDYIYERFSSIHGANSVSRPKPHGDGIVQCCKEMNIHPSRVIYVGDAPTDARAAVDARCRAAIGVLWGSNDEECLGREEGFTALCGNVEELATAIQRYM